MNANWIAVANVHFTAGLLSGMDAQLRLSFPTEELALNYQRVVEGRTLHCATSSGEYRVESVTISREHD
jgi:hypothetical protein